MVAAQKRETGLRRPKAEVSMTQYKEFQGKSLDEAIGEACAYFGVPREKLEIDILNDAKGGIFGLMGMKKACIRAARIQLGETGASLLEEEKLDEIPAKSAPGRAPKSEEKSPRPRSSGRGKTSAGAAEAPLERQKKNPEKRPPRALPRPLKAEADTASVTPSKSAAGQPRNKREAASADLAPSKSAASGPGPDKGKAFTPPDAEDEGPREGLPEFDLEKGDLDLMRRTVSEVVLRLARPIVGDSACEAQISGKRVRAVLECGEAAGLLVGRDGQTLAAVQYLASRIIARQLGASLNLHIDAGHYRERQDDKLRELALALAEKAKQSGRAQSTRPLSAYQRRLIHLALEHDPQVYTRSKGDGAQRRVIILLKRARPGDPGPETGPEAIHEAGHEAIHEAGQPVFGSDEAGPKNGRAAGSAADIEGEALAGAGLEPEATAKEPADH